MCVIQRFIMYLLSSRSVEDRSRGACRCKGILIQGVIIPTNHIRLKKKKKNIQDYYNASFLKSNAIYSVLPLSKNDSNLYLTKKKNGQIDSLALCIDSAHVIYT